MAGLLLCRRRMSSGRQWKLTVVAVLSLACTALTTAPRPPTPFSTAAAGLDAPSCRSRINPPASTGGSELSTQPCSNRTWSNRVRLQRLSRRCPEAASLLARRPAGHQCQLAIVAAGMPRSGSTLSTKLIHAALRLLGIAEDAHRYPLCEAFDPNRHPMPH